MERQASAMFARGLICVACGCLLILGAGLVEGGEQPVVGKVRQIKVVADKAPDCSTLKSIVTTVTRGCKTNDEKAIAIYNFMRLAHYHHAYPREKGGIAALKLINTYGWGLCGGLHAAQSALWREAGWRWRFVGWPGHTTVEVKYDNQWHYLDVFLKCYTFKPAPDMPGGRTIAGQADISENPALLMDAIVYDERREVWYRKGDELQTADGKVNWRAAAFFVCTDKPKGVIDGVNHRDPQGSPSAWMGIKFDDPDYCTDVNLSPGYSLELTWDPIEGAHWFAGKKRTPYHSCGNREYRNCPAIGPILEPYIPSGGRQRTYSNGKLIFAPNLANDAFLAGLADKQNVKLDRGKLVPVDPAKPASITVELQSPYVMAKAAGQVQGLAKAEVSVDGGKSFKAVDLKDFSAAVAGKYQCLVKLSFGSALKSLKIEAIVQCNRCAIPYLSPGKNKITVSVAEPTELGGNKLVVTYAYRMGARSKSYEQMVAQGARIGAAQFASWSETPTVVQKTFSAKDLPATFEIDVPTPKDKYPVYPRMLFLRREVLTPGSKPMPLPAGSAAPKIGPSDKLKTLPNPFHVGIVRAD